MAFIGILPKIPSWKEQLAENLGKGLSKGVQTATDMLVDHYQKKNQSEALSSYFGKLKEEHPGDPTYELMSDIATSPLSDDQKSAFARSILGRRDNPLLAKQQQRLDRDSLTKMYNTKIRELDDEIKYGLSYDQRDSLLEQKRALQKERDALFDSLKGANPYGDTDDDFESDLGEGDEEDELPKVRFDFNNPKHKHVRDKVLKQTRGDRKKAEAILKKRFVL